MGKLFHKIVLIFVAGKHCSKLADDQSALVRRRLAPQIECPLYPSKRTRAVQEAMSAKGPKADIAPTIRSSHPPLLFAFKFAATEHGWNVTRRFDRGHEAVFRQHRIECNRWADHFDIGFGR